MIQIKPYRQSSFPGRLPKLVTPATLHEWLIASSCFSGLLLLARVIATGSAAYLFLPWNLFLGFIPYWITGWLINNITVMENRVKFFIVITAWLLFIPNSFYIITDLFHLSHFTAAPKWFDLLLIFSFAWNGIIYGIISLRRVEVVISAMREKKHSGLLILVVMWFSALGIYIGRFLRYNSWDIITDPFSLAGDILHMVIHPFQNGYAWGMTLCYSVFMTLLYFTIKKLSESFMVIK